MAVARAVLLALLIASCARAGVPAGGMDIFADHWLDSVERHHRARPGYHGAFGDGPFRISLYGLTIGGIGNNVENASANAIVFATERHLTGRYFAGGSFGTGDSDTLEYSHGEVHVGMFVNEQLALRAGFTNDTYDYITNDADDANVQQDILRGFTVGGDLFGSPRPGWFVQLSGDLVPLESRLVGGGTRDDLSFTVRGTFLIGFSVFGNLDVALMAMAVPRLGDDQSNAGHFGGGVSLTF
jgi:hypothetical protein